jgi:Protein of unknown function DUF2617
MGVRHGQAHITELALQVFSRAVHPEWFAVREHVRVTQESWEADIRIIEGGHAIVFRSGRVRLTEVLSGSANDLPDTGLLFHSRIRHERVATLHPNPAVEYQAAFEVERVDREVFTHLTEEMALDASRGCLFHRFATQNRLAAAPVTHLRIEARKHSLSVYSFHSFPEESAIVRTQSLIEPKSGRELA